MRGVVSFFLTPVILDNQGQQQMGAAGCRGVAAKRPERVAVRISVFFLLRSFDLQCIVLSMRSNRRRPTGWPGGGSLSLYSSTGI